jgi:hypothetical protein
MAKLLDKRVYGFCWLFTLVLLEETLELQPGRGVPGQSYSESRSTAFTFSPANIVLVVTAYF